jgi:hypothetical protein
MQDIESKITTVSYLPVTELIPKEWNHWFWSALAEGEATWGSAHYTLFDPSVFHDCMKEIIQECGDERGVDPKELSEILKTLENLKTNGVFIDLES